MEAASHSFLKRLLETPSPSGYEQPVQNLVLDYAAEIADDIRKDLHGNVILCNNPGGKLRVMLAGHCDQIGLIVSKIDDQGYLYAQPIGGWDPQQLLGQRMNVWTKKGPVTAVISRKPIHLLKEEERKQAVKLEELWLDIGARNKQEAGEVVRIGDAVTLEPGYRELRNNLACSPKMDNTTGLWVVLEAFRRATLHPNVALFAVSTVAEEIGLRGAKTSAFGIEPQVGIAVDVTHATDCPTIDQRQQGEIGLGKGPVIVRGPNMNPVVTERLIDTAAARNIGFQLAACGKATSNDANTIQISRSGVATGLVSIPNRYMHSAVETISLDDIDRAADLIAAFASGLTGEEDFRP